MTPADRQTIADALAALQGAVYKPQGGVMALDRSGDYCRGCSALRGESHTPACADGALLARLQAMLDAPAGGELTEARELLRDVLYQACHEDERGRVDSGALSAYADGLDYLGRHGLFEIEPPIVGRMVIGRWPKVSR